MKKLNQKQFEKIQNLSKIVGGQRPDEWPTFTQTGEPNTSTSDSDMEMDYPEEQK